MKFNAKNIKLKNEVCSQLQIGKNTLLCVIDWFEVRVNKLPDIDKLISMGYSPELDKGCATHMNYYECGHFSIAWNIKSSYIKQVYTHVRIKNDYLYSYDVRKFGCASIMCNFLKTVFVGDYEAFVSRFDICFDMRKDSDLVEYLKNLFITESLVSGVTRYGKISGVYAHTGEKYTNYYAGNRSSFAYYRLYDKYIENHDKNGVVKKSYISDLHKSYYGTDLVERFEIEIKPNTCKLDLFEHDNFYFDFIRSRFFSGNIVVQPYLGRGYDFTDYFSVKDAYNMGFLIRKFQRFFGEQLFVDFGTVTAFLDKIVKTR